MRKAFINTLMELAEIDSRILLLTSDLGYMVFEPFIGKFPSRFFNVGVAEQNMVGLATGLAEAGFIPYVYSIVPFAVLRPYEFIRNGPIAHRLPVRIVGMGGGLEYGHNGVTHYGIEDIGVLRVQPGLTIIAPVDYEQTRSAILATWNLPGPVYYRLGKDDKYILPELNGRFKLGQAQIIGQGKDILIITMGSIVCQVMTMKKILDSQNINSTIFIISSINPSPITDLTEILGRFNKVLTVEAHYIVGGIGSLVSEVIAEKGLNCSLVRCGIKDIHDGVTGSQSYMEHIYGLSAEMLVKTVLKVLKKR